MMLTFISVIINIILAPIFIYGLELGVQGAALATVLSEIAPMTRKTELSPRYMCAKTLP